MDVGTDVTKRCRKCVVVKGLAEFYGNKRNKDGRQSYCKACNKIASNAWRATHPERWNTYSARWYVANVKRSKATNAAWHAANTERRKATHATWYAANKEHERDMSAAWYAANVERAAAVGAAWQAANPERARATHAAWQAANPERVRENLRRSNTKRKRLLAGAKSEKYSRSEIYERDEGLCPLHWCLCPEGRAIDLDRPSRIVGSTKRDPWSMDIDHILPISLGGSDTPSNARVSHHRCNNTRKNRMTPTECATVVVTFVVEMVESWTTGQTEDVA
jgi:hypothetical protein